jgi:hypothetical protein
MKYIILILFLAIFIFFFLLQRRRAAFQEPKLLVIVSTCKRYRDKTIEPLVNNLKNDGGVPDDRLVIVSGGEDSDDDSELIKKTKYQFWELTGLIWLASQEDKGDYYLLIHDTCKVDPGFWDNLQKKFREMGTIEIGARLLKNNGGSCMNMGIYKHSYLISRKGELDALKNYKDDDQSLIDSKIFGYGVEGKFLSGTPLMYSKDKVQITIEGEKCINKIPELGFTKIQQNCGQGDLKIKFDV